MSNVVCLSIVGPNKMALQTMLAKLEGEDDIPLPPSAPAPPIPGNQANISLPNSSPFRDDVAPLGICPV